MAQLNIKLTATTPFPQGVGPIIILTDNADLLNLEECFNAAVARLKRLLEAATEIEFVIYVEESDLTFLYNILQVLEEIKVRVLVACEHRRFRPLTNEELCQQFA